MRVFEPATVFLRPLRPAFDCTATHTHTPHLTLLLTSTGRHIFSGSTVPLLPHRPRPPRTNSTTRQPEGLREQEAAETAAATDDHKALPNESPHTASTAWQGRHQGQTEGLCAEGGEEEAAAAAAAANTSDMSSTRPPPCPTDPPPGKARPLFSSSSSASSCAACPLTQKGMAWRPTCLIQPSPRSCCGFSSSS